MKYLIKILTLISFSLSTYAADNFVIRAAIVDLESIFEHSIAISEVRKTTSEISNQIQAELSSKELELKKISEELKKISEELKSKKDIIKEDDFKARESDFEARVSEFDKRVIQTKQTMHTKKNALENAKSEALQQVNQTIISVISELAKEYNLNMVLPSSQVLHVDKSLNITLEVINKLNERLKTVEFKYRK